MIRFQIKGGNILPPQTLLEYNELKRACQGAPQMM